MKKFLFLAASLAIAALSNLSAGTIPYPSSGTPNATTYTFTATNTGDVWGYFAGSGAAYTEEVGLMINGVLSPAGYGLNDHTSALGASFNFGHVNAGDTLVFVDHIFNQGYVYSDPSMNSPYDSANVANHNHIYSTGATNGQIAPSIPAGVYIGFEDLSFPNSDYNYFDDTFVFTNVSERHAAPDSASTLLLGSLALGSVAMLRRRLGARR